MSPFVRMACIVLALAGTASMAQEVLLPLGPVGRPDNAHDLRKHGEGHTAFIYQYQSQALPIIDDFSIDRTRHRGAGPGDAGVSLLQTVYALEVGGVSTPDMAFVADTTWHYFVEIEGDDTNRWKEHQPFNISVRDVTVFPTPDPTVVEGWRPFTIRDTIGTEPDTIHLAPTLVQDSMLVYNVPADTRTYTNPDNSTRPLILWEEDDAYVNGGFPIDPPSVGVATFDGSDRLGYPYRPDTPNDQGRADHLTSVPIELQYPAGDSIYLSFFYQSLGRSGDNASTTLDSLLLEFYAPDEDQWFPIWGRMQTPSAPFEQVMVPIIDFRFLKNGFRMRFVNKATLGGPIDQFHIDYVRLGRNRSFNDTTIDDVSFLYPEQSLLLRYTSVPYAKFAANPAAFMAPSISVPQRNLSDQDKLITWGYRSGPDGGGAGAYAGGNNISNNAGSIYTAQFPVTAGPNNYLYDVAGTVDQAAYRTKLWLQATPDGCRYNDTVTFVQDFSNYYSYDDGTAEWGYSLTGVEPSKRLAYRYESPEGDTLRGLRMYFAPIFSFNATNPTDPRDCSFLLTVWSSVQPEQIIYQNVSFSMPEYRQWGPNTFVEYLFDVPVYVEGSFFVGLVQTNHESLSLGLDANRVNNDRMFFNAGNGWQQSSASGSWMIRPVVSAEADPWSGVEHVEASTTLLPWPNPAGEAFRLGGTPLPGGSIVHLLDATGRSVRQWPASDATFDLAGLSDGLYLVRAMHRDGHALGTGRLIVQR